jgi:hypothetical protein
VRLSDGLKVVLKRVQIEETNTMRFLSSLESTPDNVNRCAPLLDVIDLPETAKHALKKEAIVVMPFFRAFDDPTFHCRLEFFDAVKQLLEV